MSAEMVGDQVPRSLPYAAAAARALAQVPRVRGLFLKARSIRSSRVRPWRRADSSGGGSGTEPTGRGSGRWVGAQGTAGVGEVDCPPLTPDSAGEQAETMTAAITQLTS